MPTAKQRVKRRAKRFSVGLLGGLVLIVGIVAIPYPGPGWLIVFAGLGILATEFDWAKRVLDYTKAKYDACQSWLKKQPLALKLVIFALTAAIVILTLWLLNGYGLINSWLHLGQDWLKSPLVR